MNVFYGENHQFEDEDDDEDYDEDDLDDLDDNSSDEERGKKVEEK